MKTLNDIATKRTPYPKLTCAIEGCERSGYSRNVCQMHYQRWLRQQKKQQAEQQASSSGQ